MHLAEVSLGNWRFGGLCVVFVVLLVGIIPASHYCEVVRTVDLLYTTMKPQVKETERLQKIAEAQKTIDECRRVQQDAQKKIDHCAKALQQPMKENEGK